MKRAAMVVTLSVLGSLAPKAAQGALPLLAVTCGETVTTSIRVANSLFECSGSGLIVGADNIVIDLNGKTIDGNRTDDDATEESEFGIDNSAGHVGVTIRNGTVGGFEFGVRVRGSSSTQNVIERVTVHNNASDGISLETADDNIVRRSESIENGGIGIIARDSSRNRFKSNRAIGNAARGIGILGATSVDSVIANNVVEGNGVIGIGTASGSGHRILNNVARFNGNDGIEAAGTEDHEIIGNVSIGSEDDGFEVSGGIEHTITGNIARANRNDGFEISGNNGTVVEDNDAIDNGARGLNIAAGDGVEVRRNVAKSNGDHGIRASGSNHVIGENVAKKNGFSNGVADGAGLGIDASAVTALTGANNKAAKNDDPDQCDPPGPPFCV